MPAVDPGCLSLVIVMYGADTHSRGVGLLWCVWDTRAWQGEKYADVGAGRKSLADGLGKSLFRVVERPKQMYNYRSKS